MGQQNRLRMTCNFVSGGSFETYQGCPVSHLMQNINKWQMPPAADTAGPLVEGVWRRHGPGRCWAGWLVPPHASCAPTPVPRHQSICSQQQSASTGSFGGSTWPNAKCKSSLMHYLRWFPGRLRTNVQSGNSCGYENNSYQPHPYSDWFYLLESNGEHEISNDFCKIKSSFPVTARAAWDFIPCDTIES